MMRGLRRPAEHQIPRRTSSSAPGVPGSLGNSYFLSVDQTKHPPAGRTSDYFNPHWPCTKELRRSERAITLIQLMAKTVVARSKRTTIMGDLRVRRRVSSNSVTVSRACPRTPPRRPSHAATLTSLLCGAPSCRGGLRKWLVWQAHQTRERLESLKED